MSSDAIKRIETRFDGGTIQRAGGLLKNYYVIVDGEGSHPVSRWFPAGASGSLDWNSKGDRLGTGAALRERDPQDDVET
ncbi:MAG TPA: hypothetical protein VLM38_11755 [Blastocatellia bacterium]|nr:hypothetical protein [Blastocatellia bacterium]